MLIFKFRRYFTAWKGVRAVETFYLPRSITKIMSQKKVPIGDALISTLDTCVGVETCEELFVSLNSFLYIPKSVELR